MLKKLRKDYSNDADIEANVKVKKSVFVSATCLAVTVLLGTYFVTHQPTPDIEYSSEPTTAVVAPAKAPVKRSSAAEAEAAKRAVTDRAFSLQSGLCSQFGRKAQEKEHGPMRFRALYGASARITANNFLREGYGVRWPQDREKLGDEILPGDVLFIREGSGGFGHLGVYAGNGLVAENSSTRYGRVQGAKGYRSLAQFGFYSGRVDVVGRLPSPLRLYLALGNYTPRLVASGELWEARSPRGVPGQFYVQVRDVARVLGRKSNETRRLTLREALQAIGYQTGKIEYSLRRATVTVKK